MKDSVFPEPVPEVTMPGRPGWVPRASISIWWVKGSKVPARATSAPATSRPRNSPDNANSAKAVRAGRGKWPMGLRAKSWARRSRR